MKGRRNGVTEGKEWRSWRRKQGVAGVVWIGLWESGCGDCGDEGNRREKYKETLTTVSLSRYVIKAFLL